MTDATQGPGTADKDAAALLTRARAVIPRAKEIADERRQRASESTTIAMSLRNSKNPAAAASEWKMASAWQMAGEYALETARILDDFPCLVDALAAKDAELARLTAERDSFRAVLEGAQYREIDTIATNTVEQSRALGEAVMQATMSASARLVNAVVVHGKALARVKALEEALTEIAAFDDVGACEFLDKTGSYAAFDEPGAVEAARAALKGGAA
jgi:hypothetical protein